MFSIPDEEVQRKVESLVTDVKFFSGSVQRKYMGVAYINAELLPVFFFKALKENDKQKAQAQEDARASTCLTDDFWWQWANKYARDLEYYMRNSTLFVATNGFQFEGTRDDVHFLHEKDLEKAPLYLDDVLVRMLFFDLGKLLREAVLKAQGSLPE